MKLRDLSKMYSNNDGTRTLFESIPVIEVGQTLADWIKNCPSDKCVLIGGMAVSYHAKPRVTMDVDLLFLSAHDIPTQVLGFKRTRTGAFQHNITHVEVEVITSALINNLPITIIQKVFETAIESNGIKIASPSGLVALKLYRMSKYDEGDIWVLIETGKVDLTDWSLPPDKLEIYNNIVQRIKNS